MKKLYRKGTVHPSPINSDHHHQQQQLQLSLSFLPAAILTLATALSGEEREVLAYLLSCSAASSDAFDFSHHRTKKSHHNNNNNNQASLNCYCFSCYTSYWARWDSSPNRQLIHEIIDAFEDGLMKQRKSSKKQGSTSRREKRKQGKGLDLNLNLNGEGGCTNGNNNGSSEMGRAHLELGRVESEVKGGVDDETGDGETGEKQGSVRKIVSFIGERIWGSVWG